MTGALLITAWLACQGLDVGTTYFVQGRPTTYREVNPIFGQARGRTVALKVAFNVGFLIWRDRQPRL